MKHILTLLFTLAGLAGMAQTNQPLPPDAQPLTALTYLSPSDSTVWLYNERSSLAINVGVWADVQELFNQKWSNAQIDSAIAAQIGGINFPVTSVNSMTGDVTLAPTDLGLGNVDNTSDANKPISTATQDALDGKENTFSKGNLVAGTGVTLSGTLANRLVGSGNVTINSSLTESDPTVPSYVKSITSGQIGNWNTAYNRYLSTYQPESNNIPSSGTIDFNNVSGAGAFTVSSTSTNAPESGNTWSLINLYTDVSNSPQIAISSGGSSYQNKIAYRARQGNTWNTIWHSGNFTPPTVFTTSSNGLVPSAPSSGNLFLRRDGAWVDPQAGGGGGSNTDLSITNRTSTTLQINSSTGSAATIPAATTSLAGLLTAADKSALNNAITSESDPTVPSYVKSITSTNISNWNTAYGWGNFRDYGLGTTPPTVSSLSDFNTVDRPTGFVRAASQGNTPFFGTGTAVHVRYSSDRALQLWMGMGDGGRLQYRATTSDNSWGNVLTVWDSGNFNPSDYLTASNFTWSNLSGKPSTFTPSAHTHSANDINSGTLATARIPNLAASKITSGTFNIARIPTGTSSSTVAIGNDSRINNGQTAYGWGNPAGRFLAQSTADAASLSPETINLGSSQNSFLVYTNTSSSGAPWNESQTTGVVLQGGAAGLEQNAAIALSAGGSSYDGHMWFRNRAGNSWHEIWHSGNLPNPASSGTGSTQVRNNSQLDARYLQSVSGGSGVNVSGNTISVDNTVIRTTGNQTKAGTLGVTNIMGTSTTASSSIPTNAQSLFKASISSSTTYTLTNLTGSPRHIQVMITNTSSSAINVNFNANVPVTHNPTVPGNATAIFTFLIENGSAWGTKLVY